MDDFAKLIPEKHLVSVCRPEADNACIFLVWGPDGWSCAKNTRDSKWFEKLRAGKEANILADKCGGMK